LPAAEEVAEDGDIARGYRDLVVVESAEGSDHGGEDGRVESRVNLHGAVEEEVGVVALGEGVDIEGVAGGRNGAASGAGEEVEVLCRSGCQVLGG
jgi:hypothetical protein